jgi:hypothetical protein
MQKFRPHKSFSFGVVVCMFCRKPLQRAALLHARCQHLVATIQYKEFGDVVALVPPGVSGSAGLTTAAWSSEEQVKIQHVLVQAALTTGHGDPEITLSA